MTNEIEKGMSVDVYKTNSLGDCTNGGISSKFDKMILVGEGIPRIFKPSEDTPAIYLKQYCGDYIAVPDLDKQTMMGGNFVYTCDSRFRQLLGGHPIRIHDSSEG